MTNTDLNNTHDDSVNKTEGKATAEQKRQAKILAREKKSEKKAKRKAERQQRRKDKRKAKALARQRMIDENFAKMSPEEQMDATLESIAQLQNLNKKWYKLDNSALLYPMIAHGESFSVFRIAVQLKEKVNPVVLQYAVNDIVPRFPTICGTIASGWFWPYIERPAKPIVAKLQKKMPSRPILMDGKRSQIRINYFENQIAVDFWHSATDGTGGVVFLNSLLRCYFERLGVHCDRTNSYDHRDIPAIEEVRDPMAQIAVRKNAPPQPPVVKCKVIKGTTLKNGKFIKMRGICSANQLKELARKYNATITELLGAVQLLSLNKLVQATASKHQDDKPIRILVAVNLRKMFEIETVRNCASYIFYQYNGQTDIGEIIADIQEQTKQQFSKEYFQGMVSYNYNRSNSPWLKPVPLWLKRLVVGSVSKNIGEGTVNCSTLSNLGMIKAPKEFEQLVERYEFTLGKPHDNTNYVCIASYNDTCVIGLVTKYAEKDFEKTFFTTLASLGIDLAMESDVWEEEQ